MIDPYYKRQTSNFVRTYIGSIGWKVH